MLDISSESGHELYEPCLQETGYLTEDMIKKNEEAFEALGVGDEATRIRAQMQSRQLISDSKFRLICTSVCICKMFLMRLESCQSRSVLD